MMKQRDLEEQLLNMKIWKSYSYMWSSREKAIMVKIDNCSDQIVLLVHHYYFVNYTSI